MSDHISGLPWRAVLLEMYRGENGFVTVMPDGIAGDEDRYEIPIDMMKSLECSHSEVFSSLHYLEQSGLVHSTKNVMSADDGVDPHKPDEIIIAPTETGLQIAYDLSVREREQSKENRQNTINRSIMLAASVTAIASILTNWPPNGDVFPIPLSRQIDFLFQLVNTSLTSGGIVVGALLLFVLLTELWSLYAEKFKTW